MERSVSHSIWESQGLAHICDSINTCELLGWSSEKILDSVLKDKQQLTDRKDRVLQVE